MEEGKVIFGIGLDNTSFEAQIKEAEDDLEKLEQEYSALAKAPDFSEKEEQMIKLRAEIEKTTNRIEKLKEKQNGLLELVTMVFLLDVVMMHFRGIAIKDF